MKSGMNKGIKQDLLNPFFECIKRKNPFLEKDI
jgi:hypothetical protein